MQRFSIKRATIRKTILKERQNNTGLKKRRVRSAKYQKSEIIQKSDVWKERDNSKERHIKDRDNSKGRRIKRVTSFKRAMHLKRRATKYLNSNFFASVTNFGPNLRRQILGVIRSW